MIPEFKQSNESVIVNSSGAARFSAMNVTIRVKYTLANNSTNTRLQMIVFLYRTWLIMSV